MHDQKKYLSAKYVGFLMMVFKKINFFSMLNLLLFSQIVDASFTNPITVTIYVHGTTTALGLRFLSKFYTDVSFGEKGLHHISNMVPDALLKKDIELLQELDPNRFSADHFYTFGWSGKLSHRAREADGKLLYDDIKVLLKKYKRTYGFYPAIRLLTFSHGGNVALNMVKNLPFFDNQEVNLELILVAVPVQKTTASLIEHPCINKSYVISSTRDLIQLVDVYRYDKKRCFPERFFDTQASNCHQIEVIINDRGLGHIDLMRSFMIHLPAALNCADSQKQNQFYLNGKAFLENSLQKSESAKIKYCAKDPQFRFYNVFNLEKVVRGKRKPIKNDKV